MAEWLRWEALMATMGLAALRFRVDAHDLPRRLGFKRRRLFRVAEW